MQHLFSLNDLYTNYAAGLLKKEDFESAIFRTLQEDIQRFGLVGWNREDSDDYLSSLYLRISRAINAYQEQGASFESYIGSLVRLTAKEYRSRQVRGYLEETAAWITQIPEMHVCENELEYNEYATGETESQAKLKNPRQLLILLLKCCNHVSPDFLERVSPKLGIEPEELDSMIGCLKEQWEKREMDIMLMRERINRQFYRCILLEKKLKAMQEDSIAAQRLQKQLEQRRGRLMRARRRLARVRRTPSNHQIAKLLGLAKSTVDTVLYNLKMQGESYPAIDQENNEWPEEKTPRF